MFDETKREAMGIYHFSSTSRRKIFICSDRREHVILRNQVQNLKKNTTNNIKKYDDEMKDWKEIFQQLQEEKEGTRRPFQSRIERNNNTFKSSISTGRKNDMKSVRRSLAPHVTNDMLYRPKLNYELISKAPAVPHKIKLELLKREEKRIKKEKLSYSRARLEEKQPDRDIQKEPVKRHTIDTDKPITRPRNQSELGKKENRATLPRLQRSKTIDVSGTHSGQRSPHPPPGARVKNTLTKSVSLGFGNNGTTKQSQDCKKTRQEPLSVYSKMKIESSREDKINAMSKIHSETRVRNRDEQQSEERGKQSAKQDHRKRYNETLNKPSTNEDDLGEMANSLGEDEDTISPYEFQRERRPSVAALLFPKQVNRHGRKLSVTRSRKCSAEEQRLYEKYLEEQHPDLPRGEARRNSAQTSQRFEKHPAPTTGLSTTKLQEIITAEILGQVTHAQRRNSISSNQKTSILTRYTRMLQGQLKMDALPENESPDFSETPFMRMRSNADQSLNDVTRDKAQSSGKQ